MYKNKKVAVACLALVLVVLVSVVFQALPPSNAQSGRVYRYEVFVRIHKEPEDDPWASDARYLFPTPGSTRVVRPALVSGSSSTLRLSAKIHPLLDILTETMFIGEFMYSSSTTATQLIRIWIGSYMYDIMYIPSRAYQPGVLYRWVIVIPGYQDSNIVLSSFPIIESSTYYYVELPLTAECGYWDGAQMKYSTSGLSITVNRVRVNVTHLSVSYSISFSPDWGGRQVASCSIFTSDSYVISYLNSYLQSTNQRTLSGNRLYILLLSNLNIVVQSGDSVEVVAWYITTDSL